MHAEFKPVTIPLKELKASEPVLAERLFSGEFNALHGLGLYEQLSPPTYLSCNSKGKNRWAKEGWPVVRLDLSRPGVCRCPKRATRRRGTIADGAAKFRWAENLRWARAINR